MTEAPNWRSYAKWLTEAGKSQQTILAYIKYAKYELAQKRPTAFLLRDLSKSSKLVRLASMRSYATWSKDDALLEQLNRVNIRKALNSKQTAPIMRAKQFEEAEIRAFMTALDAWKGHRPEWVWPCIGLMYKLALRAGVDLLNITRKDVTMGLESGDLPIYTKGEKYRFVPAELARDRLEALLKIEGWNTVMDLISPGKKPNRASAYTMVNLACKAIGRRAGLDPKKIRTHRFRHTRAMELYVQSGHDVHLVQQLLGHASILTTQIYLKANRTADMAIVLGKLDKERKTKRENPPKVSTPQDTRP